MLTDLFLLQVNVCFYGDHPSTSCYSVRFVSRCCCERLNESKTIRSAWLELVFSFDEWENGRMYSLVDEQQPSSIAMKSTVCDGLSTRVRFKTILVDRRRDSAWTTLSRGQSVRSSRSDHYVVVHGGLFQSWQCSTESLRPTEYEQSESTASASRFSSLATKGRKYDGLVHRRNRSSTEKSTQFPLSSRFHWQVTHHWLSCNDHSSDVL